VGFCNDIVNSFGRLRVSILVVSISQRSVMAPCIILTDSIRTF